jgi:hypothetical protein
MTFNWTSNLLSLVGNSTNVSAFELEVGNPVATPAPFPPFGATVTQTITTYDGIWNGIGTSSAFQFFYNLYGTSSGTLSGAHAAIVSPFDFFCDCN